ncbi:MAG: glycosyltransferase family 2 protein, partial [Nitrosopumilales archaeon]
MDYKDDVLIKISNLSASSNKVSVIIPCFNCESFVERCIHSLVSQTYNNFEAIIVDDGSTDTSDAVIKRFFGDQRIHQIRHTKNVGLPASRNTGIRYSTGTLIAFLDSDDWWAPTKLEAQVRVFDDSNVDICAVAAKQIYCDGSSTISTLSALSKKDLYKTLLFRNCVPGSASSIMIRKKCFDSVGLFDEEMVSTEDQDMWIRLAEKYNYVFLSTQPLVFIDKTRDQSLSRN